MIKLTGITSLETSFGTISGVAGIQADPVKLQALLDTVTYPLPECEIILLPFIIHQIGEWYTMADGIADYENGRIYLTAYHPLDFNSDYYRELAWLKTLSHEMGHIVHDKYLPRAAYGQPEGLWATFKEVHQLDTPNTTYANSLEEAFAETWRLLFTPTQANKHKQGVTIPTGVKEWMLSLAGQMGLAIGHKTLYVNGECIPMDVAPIIIDGRTMVPLRFVAENLGREVGWSDPETIIISQRVPNSQ